MQVNAAEWTKTDAIAPHLDLRQFATGLAGRRRAIKSVLVDQRVIAGIGNVHADDMMFRARIHPAPMPIGPLPDRSPRRSGQRSHVG